MPAPAARQVVVGVGTERVLHDRLVPQVLQTTRMSVARLALPTSFSSRIGLPSGHWPPRCANSSHGKSSRCPAGHATKNRAGTAEGRRPLHRSWKYRARSGR